MFIYYTSDWLHINTSRNIRLFFMEKCHAELCKTFGFNPWSSQPMNNLSKGQSSSGKCKCVRRMAWTFCITLLMEEWVPFSFKEMQKSMSNHSVFSSRGKENWNTCTIFFFMQKNKHCPSYILYKEKNNPCKCV